MKAPFNIKSAVGQRIRVLRDRKGWSQEELAARAGTHRNYVGGVERGERNAGIESIAKFAMALGVRPRDLLP